METKSQFRSTYRPGFSMRFENGWTISVQWHTGAYCERRKFGHQIDDFNDRPEGRGQAAESTNAEIAIWDSQGNWYDFENDQVLGYLTSEEVLEWMNKVKQFEPK
jgi:hypothetical protein